MGSFDSSSVQLSVVPGRTKESRGVNPSVLVIFTMKGEHDEPWLSGVDHSAVNLPRRRRQAKNDPAE
eukprot:gene27365-biopygen10293